MCGITGFVSYPGQLNENKIDVIGKMTLKLSHRGPDDSGTWIDNSNNLAFGHRRLSIIDLSSAGHQPMTSSCKRFVVVFNGEIYNHQTLRKEINKLSARGLASSQGGALNIQADDEAPAVKVKKASVTSGKALNLVEEAELNEPEEPLSAETEEVSDESLEDQVEDSNQSKEESEEVASEDSSELEDAAEDSKEEK